MHQYCATYQLELQTNQLNHRNPSRSVNKSFDSIPIPAGINMAIAISNVTKYK